VNRDLVRLGGIAIVLIVLVAIGARLYLDAEEEKQIADAAERTRSEANLLERPHSPTLGPANARVTIVEFVDPECESCRAMYPVVKGLMSQYPADVRLVLRYMPLHGNSVYAAGALEAAREQGRFWEMLEIMFERQPEWGNHHHPRPELIPGYAREIGLDMDAFDHFLAQGTFRELVEKDKADGISLGVRGTPTFFVNERLLVRLGYDTLKAMIEQELAKK